MQADRRAVERPTNLTVMTNLPERVMNKVPDFLREHLLLMLVGLYLLLFTVFVFLVCLVSFPILIVPVLVQVSVSSFTAYT